MPHLMHLFWSMTLLPWTREMASLGHTSIQGWARQPWHILVERAVVTERIRLAIGLPLRDLSEYAPTDAQLEDSVIAEKYYEPPLINIISYACNACPTKQEVAMKGCSAGTFFRKSSASSAVHISAPTATSITLWKPT